MGMTEQTRPSHSTGYIAPRYLPALVIGITLFMAGCATEPMGVEPARRAPPPSVEVHFYPAKGQSPQQQDRDRYECYLWAKDKTGFDPSLPGLTPGQRVEVKPAPPSGQKAATGAFIGAVLGAATSEPGDSRVGAFRGAIAGALIGASADAADAQQAQRAQQEQARIDARLERQAQDYRRAMSACLEGRGYKVK